MAHKIIQEHKTPAASATRAGRVILVDRGCEHEPFVTAWLGDGDSSWCWGHYFNDRAKAEADFAARVRRGY